VHSSTPCVSQCSLHGDCISNICNCRSGYNGSYCENKTSLLSTNEIVTGFLDDNTWNYYTYQTSTIDNLLITVNQTTTGDCDLYIRWDSPPSRWEFDYFHIAMDSNFSLSVPNSINKILYIGLYGWSRVGYNMKITISTACIPACMHGQCSPEGLCFCDPQWSGAACDQPTTTLLSTVQVMNNITANQWHYYNFASNQPTLLIALHEDNESPYVGFLYLLISEDSTPNLLVYDHGDTSLTKPNHLVNLFLDDRPGETINWVIAVYGTGFIINPVSYHLVVWQT